MKIGNFYGMSYHFVPKVLNNINDTTVAPNTTVTQTGNKILFFNGTLPETDTLYLLETEAALRAAYGSAILMEVPNLNFTYTYTIETKKRLIKKLPVDAIEVNFLATGTIGWAAIILEDTRGSSDKIILFTDSVGMWGDDDMPIIIDRYSGNIGDKNVFKDFSLILRDISSNEV